MLPAFILLGFALFIAGAFVMRLTKRREVQDREALRRDPATRKAATSVAGLSDQSDSMLRVVAVTALGIGAAMTIVSGLALAFTLLT